MDRKIDSKFVTFWVPTDSKTRDTLRRNLSPLSAGPGAKPPVPEVPAPARVPIRGGAGSLLKRLKGLATSTSPVQVQRLDFGADRRLTSIELQALKKYPPHTCQQATAHDKCTQPSADDLLQLPKGTLCRFVVDAEGRYESGLYKGFTTDRRGERFFHFLVRVNDAPHHVCFSLSQPRPALIIDPPGAALR